MTVCCVLYCTLFLGLLAGMASGCQQNNSGANGVSAREFYANHYHLLNDNNAVIVDGRTAEMFASGHLKNAVNVYADGPELSEKLKQYADKPLIVVYCTTIRRTIRIVRTLSNFYEGGILYIKDCIQGWKRNGFQVSVKSVSDN